MKLLIATGNRHKVHEMTLILRDYGVDLEQSEMEIFEPDFDTLEEVAKEKARQAFEKLKKPVIAEDTGVFFKAYNNFPGQLAKRVYLGLGFDGLLALIRLKEDKGAYFRTVVCFYDGKDYELFSGELHGTLLEEAVSIEKDRLPYEKIFVPENHDSALADLSIDEKNRISHRSIATRKLGEWLAGKKE